MKAHKYIKSHIYCKIFMLCYFLIPISCSIKENSAFTVENIRTINDGKSYIQNTDKVLRKEFERICLLKNNDSKKDKGLILSGDMSLFYFGYWTEELETLSYDEQAVLKQECKILRDNLPDCMEELMNDSKFCNKCWTINN
ncbi:hypothetical protein [Rufibacter sp. LB8]|uniref:hypothetical protein n=1 Tax=Rufibacter sp. LB8 TaxID=2777781 RepID=UPI00178C1DB8|nr:hypothetical protein [Rufibacter sp. LB8]